jgi:very-short-patch-repair endonuclease
VPLARELVSSVETWLAEARGCLDELAAIDLSRRPLAAATLCCEKGSSLLRTVTKVLDRAAAITGRNLPLGEVREAAALQADFKQLRARIEANSDRDSELLGLGYMWLDTDWEDLLSSLRWLRSLREILGDGALQPINDALAQSLFLTSASPAPLVAAVDRWRALLHTVGVEFVDGHRRVLVGEIESSFETGRALLARLRDSIDDITTWEAFTRSRAVLASTGLGAAVEFAIDQRLAAASVAAVIERAILERWAGEVIRSDPRLLHSRADDREHCVQDFQALDRAFIQAASGRVVEQCNGRRPTTRAGVAGILLFEAEKRSRHMPVAKLLTATQPVVQQIKPCFMMSPLTVSQFLPADMRFDVVIFDEASQVRPSDAINCMYRGDRLVVAGDQKQLPPTTFFETVALDGDDEWQEDEVPDFESVLDLCRAHGFPSLTLRWHYRSQHEDLITFSNYSFYDGQLLTFPGAQQASPDLGVELFRVPGVYRRGGARDNPVEASKVVERVRFHALHHPGLSLGVVAFSEAQATAIQDALDAERIARPELQKLLDGKDRLRGFFVKNLETVQGDERDILIFSIGYGPDENGKFTKQLGPLSRKGGERRLNVAITRARRRVEVIASVGAEDFAGELGSDGTRHLKRYLDYAGRTHQRVRALAVDVAATGQDVESPFEDEVSRRIRAWGYEVVSQLGCAGYRIDLAVRHPKRPGAFALGVECDGAAYHSSRVARDRDRLRQDVLEGLGWRLYRIWGPSWYRNRGEQEGRLRRAIENAVAAPPSPTRESSPRRQPDFTGELDQVALDAIPAWTVPYQVAALGRPRPGIQMHEDRALPDLCRMIDAVLRCEAPAHHELVLRRLREAWGVQRAGQRIRTTYHAALQQLSRGGRLRQDEAGFLFLNGSRCERVRVATDDPRSEREVGEIPHLELELAVAQLVIDARSISSDELTSCVARLFGWRRRGPDITEALGLAIHSCVQRDAIRQDDRMLKPGRGRA